MYTITNNGNAFYDPRLHDFIIDKPKLVQEVNAFGALSFTLYPPHPAYDQLTKVGNILSLYQDGNLLGQYIPTYKRRVFNSGIEYKCKNIICLLDDYYYRSTEFKGSAQAFIESVLASYNTHVGAAYKIYAGNIHSASVEYEAPVPDTCWDALQTVIEKNKGYFAPRISGGKVYLDYLTESDLPVSEQKIVFGENMTDLFIETDTDNCYSVLYPFGTTEDDEPVSIASVNGGVDYLENASAVAAYGRREKRMSWTNVESPSQLLSKAQEQLSEIAALFAESVQLSAVDLHDTGVDVSALAFMTRIDCISAPHGYSHRYPATRMETVLDAPQSVSLNLGQIPMTLTDSFALERKKNASSRGGGGRAQAKAEKEFKKFETFYTQTDEKFNWLATESEWDELAQEGHVTAFTELTRTARYVEDSAKMELPFADWKTQWLTAHPDDSGLSDDELLEKYNEWIAANPYAIYNTEYSDATRTVRIISKTGINALGENETVLSRITQEADRVESSVYASQSQVYSSIGQTASNIRVELADTEQNLYDYINLTASGIRQQITNASNRTIVNDTDPRGDTYSPKDGDIWIESVHDGTWDGADGFDWEHDEDYDWTKVQGAKVWTWKNNKWQLVADRQQLVNYSDFVNTADLLISQKITELANEEGQIEVYRSLIEQSAERIRSEVYGATSDIYTYIHQTASSISIAAGQRPTTVVQNSHTDGVPTSINDRGLKENDIWIDTADQDSWDAALDFNWNDDVEYDWNELRSDKIYVYRNGKWQLAVDGTVLAEDTDLQVERDHIALLARNIDTLDGYARENFAQLQVRANEIYSEVLDRTNNLGSRITQTATQIRSEVHAVDSKIYSEIVQTASNILLHVENEISDMGASLEVTAGEIRSEVHAAKSSFYSSITQTASSIRSEVTAAKSSLYSSITQTAYSIKSEVYASQSSIYSSITQTASSIKSEVTAAKSSLYSSITQTASSIRSEVTAAKSSLYSSIMQTASFISLSVDNRPTTIVQNSHTSGEPTSINNRGLKENDIWIDTADQDSWDAALNFNWNDDVEYDWNELRSDKIYVRRNGTWQLALDGTILAEEADLQVERDRVSLLARNIDTLDGYARENFAQLQVRANEIYSEVVDRTNDLGSRITQTATQIRSEVHASESQIYSEIIQTASNILLHVENEISDMGASLEITAGEIRSSVYAAESSIYSEIAQTASNILLHVENEISEMGATLEVTAGEIRSSVWSTQSSVYSSITQTASEIKSEVNAAKSSLYSSITQTASQIRSEVASTTSSLRSSIKQNADSIELKVSKGAISSTINQTAQSVLISASKINLEGYVTATELSAESARIDNLVSGTTVATGLKATFLEATTSLTVGGNGYRACLLTLGGSQRGTVLGTSSGGIELSHSHNVSASESGGVITITVGSVLGTGQGTANFNIADTAFYTNEMSAQWATARSKVELPSQGTDTSFTVKVPSTTEGEQQTYTFTIQKGATPASSGYASVALGQTVVGRIPIGDWYDAGEAAERAKYSVHGAYLRGSSVTVTPVGSTSYTLKFYSYATLYKKKGDDYESVGAHTWYYASSEGTRYYVAGSPATYYSSGSYINYYLRDDDE